MGTRVQVGLVGQATGFKLICVDLTADEAAIHAELVAKAAGAANICAISVWVNIFSERETDHRNRLHAPKEIRRLRLRAPAVGPNSNF
jgi:hypothetical protein